MAKAAERFADATRLDPDFASAWAWQSIAGQYSVDDGLVHSNQAMPAARDAADRAVALDAASPYAHLALGIVMLQYDWDWNGAKQEFDRACQLSPGSALALHWMARWYESQGRLADALKFMHSALALDPLSPGILHDLGNELLALKNPAGALPYAQEASDLSPRDPLARGVLIAALYDADQKEKARQLTVALRASAGGDQVAAVEAARWSAVEGDPTDAHALLDRGDDLHANQHMSAAALAALAAAAQDADRLFYWLNISYDERSVHLPYARLDPRIPVADPRFVDLLDRMSLPH
jgi:Flp pilus assembly protein TadD